MFCPPLYKVQIEQAGKDKKCSDCCLFENCRYGKVLV